MRLLQDIRDNYPDDKVMLVSQWTSALELCANYLDENHFVRRSCFLISTSQPLIDYLIRVM